MKNYLYKLEVILKGEKARNYYYNNIEVALNDAEIFTDMQRCILEQYELTESGEYSYKTLITLKTRNMIKEKLGE